MGLEIKNGNFSWNLKERDESPKKIKQRSKQKDSEKTDSAETSYFDPSESKNSKALSHNKSEKSTSEKNKSGRSDTSKKSDTFESKKPLIATGINNTDKLPKEILKSEIDQKILPKKVSFSLVDINLKINKGGLVFIIGKIGSGKSSLLQALFGEMNHIGSDKGTINISNNVSYLAQKPIMITGTI